jgi:hypothetical protein
MARTLLAGQSVMYDGDPLRDLTLGAFLEKFVQKKAKVGGWVDWQAGGWAGKGVLGKGWASALRRGWVGGVGQGLERGMQCRPTCCG